MMRFSTLPPLASNEVCLVPLPTLGALVVDSGEHGEVVITARAGMRTPCASCGRYEYQQLMKLLVLTPNRAERFEVVYCSLLTRIIA